MLHTSIPLKTIFTWIRVWSKMVLYYKFLSFVLPLNTEDNLSPFIK